MTKEVSNILTDLVWKSIHGQLEWQYVGCGDYSTNLDKLRVYLNCYANGTKLSLNHCGLAHEQLSLLDKFKIYLIRSYCERVVLGRIVRERKSDLFERRRQSVTEAIHESQS